MSATILQMPHPKTPPDPGNVFERLARAERVKLLTAALRAGGYKATDLLEFREDHEWHILRLLFPPDKHGKYRPISDLTQAQTYESMRLEEELAAKLSEKEPA